ncbi:MAG: flagellin lysine-N-methylase [Gammaproteobacteria bacterium]|nr:flagellin lysine-N-methylase [Gammaproteobacteria bacterium]MDH5800932.1 flagellin lysine-N-methylase [Gammaproteobacteria bacterium]
MNQNFHLQAMEGFVCTGSQCPRSCCSENWVIGIDAATLEKWQHLGEEDRQYLLDMVVAPESQPQQMGKNPNKSCVALNRDKLCDIQLRFGHDFIPEVCRTFPRSVVQNEQRCVSTGSFSCPEIVQRFFSSGTQTVFSRSVEPSEKSDASTLLLNQAADVLDVILSQKKLPLGVMLFYITDVFNDIFSLYHAGQLQPQALQSLEDNLGANLQDIVSLVNRGEIRPDSVTAGSFWRSIYSMLTTADIHTKYLSEPGSKLKQLMESPESHENYQKIYQHISFMRKNARKSMKLLNPMLRPYLKAYFTNLGFPFAPKYSHEITLVNGMLNLAVLQIMLWNQNETHGTVGKQTFKECITEMDRRLVQNSNVAMQLQSDSHMLQVEKYCLCFIDLFSGA